MSDEKQLPAANNSILPVSSDMRTDKNDIIALGVVQRERQIKAKIKGLQKETKGLRKELSAKTEESVDKLSEFQTNFAVKELTPIKDALEKVGLKIKVDKDEDDVVDAALCIPHHVSRRDKKLVLDIALNVQTSNKPIKTDIPKEIIELEKEADKLQKKVSKNEQLTMDLHRELSKTAVWEREMRANLAVSSLKQTKEGQDFLDALAKQNFDDTPLLMSSDSEDEDDDE